MATVGAMMAMNASNNKGLDLKAVALKLIQFPPFVASILALILPRFVDLTPANPFFDKIAVTLVPLALFTVGLQLNFTGWQSEIKLLATGLGYKLILAPMMIIALAFVLHLRGIVPQIAVFEAAVAPMITAAVLADQYNLNPKLANLMVGTGILLSLITTGVWYIILQYLAAPGG